MITKIEEKDSIIKIIIAVFAVIFIIVIFIVNYINSQEARLANKIYPNIYLDGTNIGRKTKQEALIYYKKINENLSRTRLKVIYKNIPIATLSASQMRIVSNAPEIVDRAYLVGRGPRILSRLHQKILTIFGFGRYDFYTNIKFDRTKIDELISQSEDNYNKPAKNALFKFENDRVISFRPEKKGLEINSKNLYKDIEKAIGELHYRIENKIVFLHDRVIEPEVTLAKSNDFGIEEEIGEGKSDFSHSIPNRIHNVTLATSKFNGILIPKGKTLSFNDIVGDISALTGYQQAYIIKGGKTVLGDGGGVCQVSTTLFRAALNTGLPITERWAHAYRVGYYENDSEPGYDATVYAPTNDLKIVNNRSSAILIQTEIVGNILYFRLYGKRDDRKIEISNYQLFDESPAPSPSYQDDLTLKKGVTKQVDFAAAGAKVSFNYKVSSAANPTVNFEKAFFSSYRPWQAVYLVGQAD